MGHQVAKAAAALIGRGVARASRAAGFAVRYNVASGVRAGESSMRSSLGSLEDAGDLAKRVTPSLRGTGSESYKVGLIKGASSQISGFEKQSAKRYEKGAKLLGVQNVLRRNDQLTTSEKNREATAQKRINDYQKAADNYLRERFNNYNNRRKATKGVAALTGRNVSRKKGV